MLENIIKKNRILIIILIFGILLRLLWINALVERDEGQFAYNSAVNYAKNNVLYKKAYFEDNKLPILYLFYSIPITAFGNDFFYIRMFNNIFFFITIILLYKICISLFENKKKALLSTFFYVLIMHIPYFEGFLVMSESVALHFTIIGFYFYTRKKRNKQTSLLFTLFFFLLAFLTRITLLINFIILIAIEFLKTKSLKKLSLHTVAIILLILLSCLFVPTFTLTLKRDLYRLIKINYVPYTNWIILFLESLTFIILGIIGLAKIKIKHKNMFFFAFIITLSLGFLPNAYGHYFISCLPYLAILCAVGFNYVLSKKNIIILLFLSLTFILNVSISTLQYPNLTWNYLGFGWDYSDSSTREVQEEISSLLYTFPSQEVFVLGWEPYICFRSKKVGCTKFFSFYYVNRSEEYKKTLYNSTIILLYESHKKNYKTNNISLTFPDYKVIKKEEYTILLKQN